MKPLTKDQAQQLLTALHDHNMKALFVLALTTGMRRGEILALKWQEIDFDQNTLRVRRIFTRSKGHRYVLAEPKTEMSRRNVILPSITVDLLKQHRMSQQQAKSEAGEYWQANDLFFCTAYRNAA
jgi:integrase